MIPPEGTTPKGMVSDSLRCTLPSHPKYLPLVRAMVQEGAVLSGIPAEDRLSMLLAVTEAWTNVIRHVYGDDTTQRMDFQIEARPGQMTMEIEDYGTYVDPATIASRPLEDIRPGGLGVHLIKSTMDEVEYRHNDHGGTTLHLVKHAPSSSEEPGKGVSQ